MDMKRTPNIEFLDIVNEDDVVIDQKPRSEIHGLGLLHREIHVWFVTPDGKIIFQHRAKDKETYPDLLDVTVGGHVEPGMTYEETAIKEMEEEAGIHVDPKELFPLGKIRRRSVDTITGKINNVFRMQYAYIYEGEVSDLQVEKGKSLGFEVWSIDRIGSLKNDEKKRFVPFIYSKELTAVLEELKKLTCKQTSFVSIKVHKGLPSKIHGRGLFAVSPISKDEVVAKKAGCILNGLDLKAFGPTGHIELQIADDSYLGPKSMEDFEKNMIFINHSCDPNVGIRGDREFVAMRDIEIGEELAIDYAMIDDVDSVMSCTCGSVNCRKTVTGRDWEKPELQRKYRGYFSKYLEDKIVRG